MIDDILREYKHLCSTDHKNRKRLQDYNLIQCKIIKDSGIGCIKWIGLNAQKYASLIDYVDTVEELKRDLYK